ncbi:MAG TPA: ATP-grasp domain-containing protein, partial [Methanomicrobiales archaeon]|nr:ATP-grasp domain-containing protein [Methanomicrobiales archaeon]
MKGRVLIAGFATRHVACSAWKAGYTVYAVDHFCDQDLSWYTEDRLKFEDLGELPDRIAEMAGRHEIDLFVPTSGAETIGTPISVTGTDRSTAARLLDKLEVQRFFEGMSIPVPPLAGEEEFPYIVKPRGGAGGWRNAVIRSADDLARWREEGPGTDEILQKQVVGTPASVSCMADGRRAVAIAMNEQLLRGEGISPFGFIGSITPLDHPLATRMKSIAVKAAAASGCVGSVGIDFVLGEDSWAIEVNPRFQATVDTVEASTGLTLFALHTDACNGKLPRAIPDPIQYAARQILFADHDLVVKENLARFAPHIADIPWPGTAFEDGQAVVSVFGTGRNRSGALQDLDNTLKK